MAVLRATGDPCTMLSASAGPINCLRGADVENVTGKTDNGCNLRKPAGTMDWDFPPARCPGAG